MDSSKRKNFILNEDMHKVIIKLSIPIVISNLIQTLYSLADGLWVSKLGSVQFAATSFVWPVNFLFISLGMGLSMAGTSILSQLIGAGKIGEANKYAKQMVGVSFLISILFSVFGFFISHYIVDIMGATSDLAYYSKIYLRINFLEIPFMFLFFNFNSILTAQGNTLFPTFLSAFSGILNVVLDPVFIFVFKLGIAGAAIATVISRAVLILIIIPMVLKGVGAIKLNFKDFRFDRVILKNIFKVAIPSSVGQSGSALGFMVLNSFIASYGTATIAAFGMVNRITSLVMQPAMGIGTAIITIVGQNLGADNIKRARESFVKASKITIIISVVGCIAMLVWNEPIVNFFMQSKDDMEVIKQGVKYLNYIAVSTPLMGLFSTLQGLFQGSGHTKYSMFMEIGRLWFVRLPMILIFKYFTEIGNVGIWFSMSFSNLIICIYGYIVFKKGRWKEKIIHSDVEI